MEFQCRLIGTCEAYKSLLFYICWSFGLCEWDVACDRLAAAFSDCWLSNKNLSNMPTFLQCRDYFLRVDSSCLPSVLFCLCLNLFYVFVSACFVLHVSNIPQMYDRRAVRLARVFYWDNPSGRLYSKSLLIVQKTRKLADCT